ncbi:MAG: ABC transporter substrate-binding protein [Sphingosinicella sp.]|nr:ABC transporter substrate-binding protein [Sphingosinicella sp.]
MRVFACILAASLIAGVAEAAPKRVASLNLCTDELLLTLGEPAQTLSVTHLAQQAAETPLWKTARQYRRNDGSLLSVIGMKPDLILTMGGGARDRVRIAERLGLRIVDVPYPTSLADIEKGIGAVAAALDRPEAGRRVLAEIARLKAGAPSRQADTIWIGGGGRSVAAKGLAADWMRLAGLSQRRLQGDRVSLERLLVAPPSVLLRSNYRQGQYSNEQRWLSHPLASTAGKSRILEADGRRWTCMGPLMVSEIQRLRREVGQ